MVYAGVWGYNGFLSAACLGFFLTPNLRLVLLAVVNAAFTAFFQAAMAPVFAAVGQSITAMKKTFNFVKLLD